MTKQRSLIYKIVENSTEHMTAEQIFSAAKEQMDSIARATVYNNLNTMTRQGLIRRVRIFGQPDRYDHVTQPHDHLICDQCGSVTDISIGNSLPDLERKAGLTLSYYELNLYYTCDSCKQRIADANVHQ